VQIPHDSPHFLIQCSSAAGSVFIQILSNALDPSPLDHPIKFIDQILQTGSSQYFVEDWNFSDEFALRELMDSLSASNLLFSLAGLKSPPESQWCVVLFLSRLFTSTFFIESPRRGARSCLETWIRVVV